MAEPGAGDVALDVLVDGVDLRGGTIEFRFKVNEAESGYEVATMFPEPPRRKPETTLME